EADLCVEQRYNYFLHGGAYADLPVKLGLIKLLQKRYDIHEEASNLESSTTCLVSAGSHEIITQTIELPKEIPPAPFVIQVQTFDINDMDMACANLNFDFRKKP
ncbi:hypothetical protein BDV93DRAFT_446478, partial [Ceratobasidium sp. AG-I]